MAGFAAVPEVWAGCEEAIWLVARRPPTPEIEATMASVTTASSLRWETRFLGLVLLGWEPGSDILLSSVDDFLGSCSPVVWTSLL
jgi:hypothetical protein